MPVFKFPLNNFDRFTELGTMLLPGRHGMNLGMLLGNVAAMGLFMSSGDLMTGIGCLGTATALSSIMGVTLTMAIGGKSSC